MHASYDGDEKHIARSLAADVTDAPMVGWMRLALSVSVWLIVAVDPAGANAASISAWLLVSAYVVHSVVLCIFSQMNQTFSQSKLIHWLDVCWYTLIVIYAGGNNSFFFLLFFFAIFTASFRWGFEEGARVTLASAMLAAACSLTSDTGFNMPHLLLRITFLLTFGYMSSYWGEKKIGLTRRLVLLREVSRLSNPRFGVDHTITSVLRKTMAFFEAGSCILVMCDKETGSHSLRVIKKKGDARQSILVEPIGEHMAGPLMAYAQDQTVVYSRPRWLAGSVHACLAIYARAKGQSISLDSQKSDHLSELLETSAFITAPVFSRKAVGRIYVVSRESGFRNEDALFLTQIAAQAFPVIDNIELLDRMASEAAQQERQKIALNLHDTAIQPYIGLTLGLSAMRKHAAADNPLIGDIDKLMSMAQHVIDDLRHYACTFRTGPRLTGPLFLEALQRQVTHVREFYGIDIALSTDGALNLNDRLTAEILHVVREGLSNICKHTVSHQGFLRLRSADGWLRIQIENELGGVQPIPFLPRSLAERAATLGGNAHVMQGTGDSTVVQIDIPI